MEKTNIIMSEKEFMEFGRKMMAKYPLGSGEGVDKIIEFIKDTTRELDAMTVGNEDILDFSDDDLKVLAHFANLTLQAARAGRIEREEAHELHSTQLALIFAKGGQGMIDAAMNVLDPAFRPWVASTLINIMGEDMKGGE